MTRYVGIVDQGEDVWGVVLPDFPGCHGGGTTPADAVSNATSALREFVADMIDNNEELPEPTDLGVIMDRQKSGEEPRGPLVYVPLLVEVHHKVKANITVDSQILKSIDQAARDRGLTRSTFLVTTAIERIERGD